MLVHFGHALQMCPAQLLDVKAAWSILDPCNLVLTVTTPNSAASSSTHWAATPQQRLLQWQVQQTSRLICQHTWCACKLMVQLDKGLTCYQRLQA